ncbi:sigma-70 family RNA polymerase sigma factor [Chitinophaga sp. 212800010-3]|uniref:RNA polymerase sigma factor n=1 Tax=unclassified Chitinophaga TaxID=2619133 RepID=UPI002DEA7FCD|nr:RNA polymerase sigma-70 factor, ECF subfamily [Chitinophaga sp. 212800010-3]
MLFQIADGNPAAMKAFFDTYYPRLYYFAYKLLQEETEAQDFAQEALVAFWQRRQDFRHAELRQAEAFLFTTVRNKCINLTRHRKMKTSKHAAILIETPVAEETVEARLIQEDVFNRIYQEVEQLPAAQAAIIRMIFVEGLETNEIAERLATTPNNVRNQKARALEKVRTLILKKGLLITWLLAVKIF